MTLRAWAMILSAILLGCSVAGGSSAAGKIDCQGLAYKIAQNGDIPDFRPPLEGKVIGKGRAYFHDAPNPACARKAFLVPGDMTIVRQAVPGWAHVVYISAEDGEEYGGWLKEDRVGMKGRLGQPEPVVLPKDVAAFIGRREDCEHFLGEEPYDEERRVYLEKTIKETCSGSNRQLQSLRQKYTGNVAILQALAGYEELAE